MSRLQDGQQPPGDKRLTGRGRLECPSILLCAGQGLLSVLTVGLETDADKFRTQIKADADKEIERLKSSLQIEIERLKSSLQMVATEHQVRFTKLHERRAEIIADLYKKLIDLHRHAEFFVVTGEEVPQLTGEKSSQPAKNEEFRKLLQEMGDLHKFYREHQIYLPLDVCNSLEGLVDEIRSNVWDAGVPALTSEDAFTEGYTAFEEKIPMALKALENEFRKMLGVENE